VIRVVRVIVTIVRLISRWRSMRREIVYLRLQNRELAEACFEIGDMWHKVARGRTKLAMQETSEVIADIERLLEEQDGQKENNGSQESGPENYATQEDEEDHAAQDCQTQGPRGKRRPAIEEVDEKERIADGGRPTHDTSTMPRSSEQ